MSDAAWMVENFGDPKVILQDLFDLMDEEGIVKLTGQYQGGHDEGGAEEIIGFTADGTEIDVDYRSLLADGVNNLLCTKFGSWALGASHFGNFTVDAIAKKAWTEGEVEEWVEDKDPMEVAL